MRLDVSVHAPTLTLASISAVSTKARGLSSEVTVHRTHSSPTSKAQRKTKQRALALDSVGTSWRRQIVASRFMI